MSALLADPKCSGYRPRLAAAPAPSICHEPNGTTHGLFAKLIRIALCLILLVPLVALVIAGASFLPAILLGMVIFLPAVAPVLLVASAALSEPVVPPSRNTPAPG